MKTIGNILWLVFGGFWVACGWFLAGVIYCVFIIGIPVGLQCFKIARLVFWPFGKEIEYGTGAGSFIINIFWLIFGGLELALASLVSGLFFCITIVGIPFGLQMFKYAKLALMPFGAKIIEKR